MSISDIAFLEDLETIVNDRLRNADQESYTAQLAAAGTKRIAQKVGEEGVELALAAATGNKDEIVDEAADLLYHVIVLLAAEGLGLKEVCDRLRTRHSGR
jgi:phosphoribosyl-AMP cyclohydrolase / phosphoribosyl-ATP pyrophosphohydrolase